mmetsp:Transcript_1787/g.3945  ORF Transcript_1787/g.3945 Transcript_1787/m.3945 type:complete len:251 (+) Transcript_1787:180-932(+)
MQIQVTVPEGVNPGDELTVAVPPENQHVTVRVPAGVTAGMQFAVEPPRPCQTPVVLGRPVDGTAAGAAGAFAGPGYPVGQVGGGGPMNFAVVDAGNGQSMVVAAIDDRVMVIMRYASTVKCISLLDVVLCSMMGVFYNPYFAIISPLALCGFWGAKKLSPAWLLGYQLFITLEIGLRLLGGFLPNIFNLDDPEEQEERQRRVSLWALLIVGVNVYIFFIVNRLRMAIMSLTEEQREELRQPRDFNGFAFY